VNRRSTQGFFGTRVLVAFTLCFAALVLVTIALSSAAQTQPVEIFSKIAPEVLAETTDGGNASVVILLADQADVRSAHQMKDANARGWFVYNTLTQHAARTQAGLRADLEARGVSYQSYWAANMIVATGNRATIESIAARSDVARIDSNNPVSWIEPPEVANPKVAPNGPTAPNTTEWGVQNVNAPAVWAMGYTGTGIVIGEQDTGVRWTHAALKPHYRGWNGTSADHNFNWHDAIHTGGGVCGPNTQAPCDDSGHGTHTAGTTLGDDGGGNQIGVAPGARWIGCRNMDQGAGTPARYTECFQFMMAPTDLAGNNPDPTLRAHVLNNSWGCPAGEGCTTRAELETIINNTEAAGIFVVVSAGNSGPGCSTVSEVPGIYAASFSVGAYDINNVLAAFSSRGPSTFYMPDLLKPNLSAPGVNVRSSTPTSDTSFGTLSGTSMASPHVAGVVALLWSARPNLERDIAATKSLLQNTANPSIFVSPAQVCGGTTSTQIPNNSFGYGRIDALAVVNASAPASPTPTATATGTPTPTATATATATPTAAPSATPSPTPTPVPATLLSNISTRSRVEPGDNALIGGFIITGLPDKRVVLRALGPSVSTPDPLPDPNIELRDASGAVLAFNDNWQDSPDKQAIMDAGMAPPNELESAILIRLPANGNAYTAIVRQTGSATGTGLVEVYDIEPTTDTKLANISSRGRVETGDNILIAGTIVTGPGPQKVAVRAIGPSLNVPGQLVDPTLELRDANGTVIRADDNWRTGGQESEIMQAGVAPSNESESALIATLPANGASYTAVVRGVNDTTGIAVVEIYALGTHFVPLYTVKTTSDLVVAGACQSGGPDCSLRGAIEAANGVSDSVITFAIAEPCASSGCVINLTQPLPTITSKVTIDGPGPRNLTVRRDTGGNYGILTVQKPTGTVIISGLTISNGGTEGAGIAIGSGTVNVLNCQITGNNGGQFGGGFSNFGTLDIRNSTISNNTAEDGGGIYNAGSLTITNSTLAGNSSTGASGHPGTGGAIRNSGILDLSNCTVTGNSALSGGRGGGLYNFSPAAINLKSSIVANNVADFERDVSGQVASQGYNLIGTNDGASSFPEGNPNSNNDIVGTNAAPIDPKLDPAGLQNNGGLTDTIALLPSSPAIDKGTSAAFVGNLTTDQRGSGFPRVFDNPSIGNASGGDGTDMGAFELQTAADAPGEQLVSPSGRDR
jgi:serine protease AprX